VDNGSPIDSHGTIVQIDDGSLTVDGAPMMMNALAQSCQVRQCVALKWAAHALNIQPVDRSSADEIAAAFADSGFNIRSLIGAIAQSQLFLGQ
jgi:hypothetical protein